MRRIAIAVLLLVAACSTVPQSEYDDLQVRYDELRDDVAAGDVEAAELIATETAIAAYVAATDPLDVDALRQVYAPDVEVFDAARGITFRTRDTALADLGSGVAAFGIVAQRALSIQVSPLAASVEWETVGVDDAGLDWSFRGVSILEVGDGLVTSETLYYDPADAPWSP